MNTLRLGGILVCALGSGCEPPLLVGDLQCSPSDGGAPARSRHGERNEGPLPAPWQTSFDDSFCGYKYQAGFCYTDSDLSLYRLVTDPVHTGPFAAAFEMQPSDAPGQRQTRCVREGVLPSEAYYGAWYYVPSELSGARTWNLFHFRGGLAGQPLRGLWDVSLDDSNGTLSAFVLAFMGNRRHEPTTATPIPLDRWFHLEFYIKSAPDTTGEVALFQDDEELLRVTDVITNDTPFTQWYVGNFAATIAPNAPTAIVYVDDVSVRLP